MTLQPVAQAILDAAADHWVPMLVRGLPTACWRCGAAATPPVLVHPSERTGPCDVIDAFDGVGLSYARELLAMCHDPLVRSITTRYSKTARQSYLSNGCPQCDAPFGAYPLAEAVDEARAATRITDLPVLLQADRPMLEWWLLEGYRTYNCLLD